MGSSRLQTLSCSRQRSSNRRSTRIPSRQFVRFFLASPARSASPTDARFHHQHQCGALERHALTPAEITPRRRLAFRTLSPPSAPPHSNPLFRWLPSATASAPQSIYRRQASKPSAPPRKTYPLPHLRRLYICPPPQDAYSPRQDGASPLPGVPAVTLGNISPKPKNNLTHTSDCPSPIPAIHPKIQPPRRNAPIDL